MSALTWIDQWKSNVGRSFEAFDLFLEMDTPVAYSSPNGAISAASVAMSRRIR
jgi:hypothetical protein